MIDYVSAILYHFYPRKKILHHNTPSLWLQNINSKS